MNNKINIRGWDTMGKIIAIDGLDGSGKGTQAKMLYEWLLDRGYNAHLVSFPNYSSNSSSAVKMYLNGEIGDNAGELNPYMCSSFYAVDRAIQFKQELEDIYKQHDSIIVVDRYISANIIHQGGKIVGRKLREDFFKWAYEYETKLMGIPQEDVTIFLEVPVKLSQKLMLVRYNGDESKKDIHETDTEYLQVCYDSAISAVGVLNKQGYNWQQVNCTQFGDTMRTRKSIFKDILNIVGNTLDIDITEGIWQASSVGGWG